jgi:hypothetical protein
MPTRQTLFGGGNGKNMAPGNSLYVRIRSAHVVGLPRVGGLHHRYAWRQAA